MALQVFLDDRDQGFYNLRIKLSAGAPAKLGKSNFHWKGLSIGTVRGHCVKCVQDGDDARPNRDLFPDQPLGISLPVIPFLMIVDDWNDRPYKFNSLNYFSP